MRDRLRAVVALCRPSLVLLLGLSAVLGLAQAGATDDLSLSARVLVVVVAFEVASVMVNDLADVAVDRINLPGAAGRPLVTGLLRRSEAPVVALVAGALAVGVAASLGRWPMLVVAAGLALACAYSLPPVALSRRGAIASLVLPAALVGVPFLTGLLAARPHVVRADLLLLGGLYVGFIARILLKDFRDVVGDTLLGKRTFLVRHGRRVTCAISAAGWLLAPACLLGVRHLNPALVAVEATFAVVAVVLVRALADDRGPRRDERLISALAIVGRGIVVCVAAHLAAVDAGWSTAGTSATTVALAVVTLGQARTMVRLGPAPRWTAPARRRPGRTDEVGATTAGAG